MRNKQDRLHIDLEVFSECNLKDAQLFKYSEHPSTEIIFWGYKYNDGPVKLWSPIYGEEMPEELKRYLKDPKVLLVAHNAQFERTVLLGSAGQKIGIKKHWLKLNRFICTMAKALMLGVSASLEKCALDLQLPQKKDRKGSMAMKAITKPDKNGKRLMPEDVPGKYEITAEYCIQDVNTEAYIDAFIPDLSAHERLKVWAMDQEINSRGIKIDLAAIEKIKEFSTRYREEQTKAFVEEFGFKPTQVSKVKEWLEKKGHPIDNTQKETLKGLLETIKDPQVRRFISWRLSLSKASVKKYDSILKTYCSDERIRGLLVYHGAATGRWAGKIIQPQNLTKEDKAHKQDQVLRFLKSMDYESFTSIYSDVEEAFKRCIRGVLIADKGKSLAVADLKQIEARVIAYLAGDKAQLEVFREGKDIYIEAAAKIYTKLRGTKVTPEEITGGERDIGKVAELALGYQGGYRAFQNMARIYGVSITDKEADTIKRNWRDSKPDIVNMWNSIEEAAKNTILTGKVTHAAKCRFQRRKQNVIFENGEGKILDCMMIELPSKRRLYYYKPFIKNSQASYVDPEGKLHEFETQSIGYWGVKQKGTAGKKFMEIETHGGKLTENIVQAVARDVLAYHLLEMRELGYEAVLHVHDEVILEVPDHKALDMEPIYDIMRTVPPWLEGVDLDADGFSARRYNK